MTKTILYPHWKERIVYSSEGPQPQILLENEKIKFILAGLEPGQQIPEHAEAQAIYHFLEGNGWMMVDGERTAVSPGATIVMPEGAVRGLKAETRLAFLATRIS
jgi:quercetin dioxygenase-like cupin family protein